MRRQLQGIALILMSILLLLGFDRIGAEYVFDLSLQWAHLFMLLGATGVIMVFWKEK